MSSKPLGGFTWNLIPQQKHREPSSKILCTDCMRSRIDQNPSRSRRVQTQVFSRRMPWTQTASYTSQRREIWTISETERQSYSCCHRLSIETRATTQEKNTICRDAFTCNLQRILRASGIIAPQDLISPIEAKCTARDHSGP